MFIDARTIAANEPLETDICIVGAGAAGITLAHAFNGLSIRVGILEGGALEFDPETQDLNAGESIGLPYFPLGAARLRYFGGTTNHWGGTCRPFDAIDFEARPWVPRSGWPMRKSDLQPYYERAQSICHVRSSEWSADYWLARDRFHPLPLSGERLITRVAQVVPSASRKFALNHRAELERSTNITLYLNANLTQLATDSSGRTVTEAHVACLSGNKFVMRAKQFILAAGAIENARLLLLSNQSQPAGLGNQHDLVGRCFMEHPRLVTGIWQPAEKNTALGFYDLHHAQGTEIKGYMALSEDTVRREELVDIQIDLDPVYPRAYVDALESDDVVELKAMLKAVRQRRVPDEFRHHVANVLSDVMTWQESTVAVAPVPLPKPAMIDRFLQTDAEQRVELAAEFLGNIGITAYAELHGSIPLDHVEVSTRVEQIPNPDSRITLVADRDALGMNRVQLDWRLTSLERHTIVRALEILGAELGRGGLGRLQVTIDEKEAGWPDDLHGGWHHMGTTRMSEDPRQGVVDSNCQVHDMANLFIAGSSVFPTSGGGTPTLTLVSLALRLADHLKGRMA
jgi:choline dehydrogenase-like flavoprotein